MSVTINNDPVNHCGMPKRVERLMPNQPVSPANPQILSGTQTHRMSSSLATCGVTSVLRCLLDVRLAKPLSFICYCPCYFCLKYDAHPFLALHLPQTNGHKWRQTHAASRLCTGTASEAVYQQTQSVAERSQPEMSVMAIH